MFIKPLLSAALALVATATPVHQQPILKDEEGKLSHKHVDVIKELEQAGIMPTILDPFTPLLTLNASWKKATAELGNIIKPKKTKHQPSIHFIDTVPSLYPSTTDAHNSNNENDKPAPHLLNSDIQLTIALTDPDAPSRLNPEWSQICHWIATDVRLEPSSSASERDISLTEIMPYKPPGPPPKTGAHRYIFVALAPRNGTTDRLHLSTPSDRQRWGYAGERAGLREWAGENGLVVVGE
ncbi:hypothetical protein Q7P37_009396 [Cladosporium fusiforme]